MTKKELEETIVELRKQLSAAKTDQSLPREKISEFLGSVSRDEYSNDLEVDVLDWPQIYFRLGRLVSRKDQLETLISVRGQVDFLTDTTNAINKKLNGMMDNGECCEEYPTKQQY